MSEGLYIAKTVTDTNTTTNIDDWTKISNIHKRSYETVSKYSYEDNLNKKLERKRKNYLYKINKNKKELVNYVNDNSLFIKNRLAEEYIIVHIGLKKIINSGLDNLEFKLELANDSENLREFLVFKDEVVQIIKEINTNINKENFTQLILDNKISNKNISIIDKIKNTHISKTINSEPKIWKKIESGLTFADILKKTNKN